MHMCVFKCNSIRIQFGFADRIEQKTRVWVREKKNVR